MSKQSDDARSRFVPKPELVWFGRGANVKQYEVTPAAWGSLSRLKDVLRDLLNEVTEVWNADLMSTQLVPAPQTPAVEGEQQPLLPPEGGDGQAPQAIPTQVKQLLVNENLWVLIDKLLEKPAEIFKLAIPEVDETLFALDNKDGITIAQVWEAFEVIIRVNRLEVAKKALSGLLNPASPR